MAPRIVKWKINYFTYYIGSSWISQLTRITQKYSPLPPPLSKKDLHSGSIRETAGYEFFRILIVDSLFTGELFISVFLFLLSSTNHGNLTLTHSKQIDSYLHTLTLRIHSPYWEGRTKRGTSVLFLESQAPQQWCQSSFCQFLIQWQASSWPLILKVSCLWKWHGCHLGKCMQPWSLTLHF